MKTISITEARKLFTNSFDNERFDNAEKTFNEVLEFIPTATLSVEVRTENDRIIELNSIDITIQTEPFTLEIAYNKQYKKHSLFPQPFYGLKNIDIYDMRNARERVIEPNNMGKLSLKKLNDWIAYHKAIYGLLCEKNNTANKTIANFRNELAEAEKAGLTVKYWNDGKQGYIKRGGLEFEFTITNSGVDQRIKISASNTLENFIKMTDNKY